MFAAPVRALPRRRTALAYERPARSRWRPTPSFRAPLPRSSGAARRWCATRSAITMLSGGARINVIPAESPPRSSTRACCRARAATSFLARIESTLADPRLDRGRADPRVRRPTSPADTPLYEAIERVAAQSRPAGAGGAARDRGLQRRPLVPARSASSPTASCRAGCTPPRRAASTAPNERISIENLARGVETTIDMLASWTQSSDARLTPADGPRRYRSSRCLADHVEERLDLLDLEAREGDAQVGSRRRRSARSRAARAGARAASPRRRPSPSRT